MSTKFLRKTVRRIIRDNDQFQDAYPKLIRSSDPLDNGIDSNIKFSDNRTIVFSTNNTTFPAMVPVGSTTLPSSSISANVVIDVAAVEQSVQLPGSVEGLEPFNESLFSIPGTSEYTTTSSLAYGFTSAARNKIAIPIDITPTQEKLLCRLRSGEVNTNPNSEFYGKPSTGFCYFNFDLKRWEDIGFGYAPSYNGHMGKFSGHRYFMAQFQGTSNLAHITNAYGSSQNAMTAVGYKNIGSPTMFFDAPNARRYYATGSQALSLSNYIDQPFMLERVDVTLPFVARRKHPGQPFTSNIKDGAYRDVDNLVFFLYRQTQPPSDHPDGAQIASQRFLITYGSLTFYNSKVNEAVSFTTHNPEFSYDYNIPLTSIVASTFTGSVTFSIYPKDYPAQFGGVSSFSSDSGYSATTYLVETMNFWPGSVQNIVTASADADVDNAGFYVYRTSNAPVAGDDYADTRFKGFVSTDTRLLKRVEGSLIPSSGIISNALPQTGSSPYLLLPTDQLIFGIESDVCTVLPTGSLVSPAGYDDSFLSQTGSFFKLLAEKAQVTLFGSLIQSGISKTHNSLNQNLISPAVHEIVANIQDDSDQFDVAEKKTFYGNYIDNYVAGSILDGTRRVYASLTNDPPFLSGSFTRQVMLVDDQKTYYQNGPTTISIGPPPFTSFFDIAYSNPTKPKNYFRYDRYGNLRDMLEQARDYRIFNKTIYKKSGGFEEQGPAYAKFVLSSSDIPVSASLTQCNNLSPYMTGTFPFTDDVGTSTSRGPYTTTQNNPFIPITNIFKT
jgi:hypothetical protein